MLHVQLKQRECVARAGKYASHHLASLNSVDWSLDACMVMARTNLNSIIVGAKPIKYVVIVPHVDGRDAGESSGVAFVARRVEVLHAAPEVKLFHLSVHVRRKFETKSTVEIAVD